MRLAVASKNSSLSVSLSVALPSAPLPPAITAASTSLCAVVLGVNDILVPNAVPKGALANAAAGDSTSIPSNLALCASISATKPDSFHGPTSSINDPFDFPPK